MVKLHISGDWGIYHRKGILILGSQTLSAGKLHVSLVVILETSMWLGSKGKAPNRREMVHFQQWHWESMFSS